MRRAEFLHDRHAAPVRAACWADRLETAEMIRISISGLGHQCRALRDLVHALHQFVHAGQVAGADRIAHAGMGLHHVGGDAAGVEQGVMDAGVARHVLAHVVDADIHQFDGVERAAAEMRRGGGMRGAAGEDEIGAGVGERRRHHDFPEAGGMPGDGDVGILEGAGAHHEGFGRAAFFRGAAVIAHAPRHLVGGEPVLHGGGGEQRGRAEQIVAAAMAMAARLRSGGARRRRPPG